MNRYRSDWLDAVFFSVLDGVTELNELVSTVSGFPAARVVLIVIPVEILSIPIFKVALPSD